MTSFVTATCDGGGGGRVFRHAANDKEFVHADFINIPLVFVLADVIRPLVEGSFDIKIDAFFKLRRQDRQIPVEDEAEPIGVLSRLFVASEAIGLSKPGI